MKSRLSTAEVAARLGVKPETIYAYVSRGLLGSERGPAGSTFDPVEVDRLARRARRAAPTPQRPMLWVTELTLIEDGRCYYRGIDSSALAGQRHYEEVAEWLMTGAWPSGPPKWSVPSEQRASVTRVLDALGPGASPVDRFTVAVATAATADPLRHDLSPETVANVGRRIITLLADDLAGVMTGTPVATARRATTAASIAARVTAALVPGRRGAPGAEAAVDAALVLLADHELAASTLAARTAAAFRADPYAVVGAGLGASGGNRHAAASTDAHAMLLDAERVGAAAAVGEVLRRGLRVPGCGMPLYPDGDPRAERLIGIVRGVAAPAARLAVVDDVWAAVRRPRIPPPNIDLALASLVYVLGAPVGTGEAMFVLARVAGWVAHAIEQYADEGSFRVRATYAGPRPGETAG